MRKILFLVGYLFLLLSCDEESSFEYTNIEVKLTASSAAYEKVIIELNSIRLYHLSPDNKGTWIELDKAGTDTYNLLEYKNGKNALISSTKIAPGKLTQLSLTFGKNNSIVTSDGTFELNLLSPESPEVLVYFDGGFNYEEDKIVFLDFDIYKSITLKTNGAFYLQPILRAYFEDLTGAIEGTISPVESNPSISVNVNSDTYKTIIDSDGYFCVLGLTSGNYNLDITPESPYIEKVVQNIVVSNDSKSNIGTVILEKEDNTDFVALTLKGDLNIEPSTSAENKFIMQTPPGQIDIDLITSQGDTYTYAGPATEILITSKAQGATLNVDNADIQLDKSIRYSFKSTVTPMKVNLRNIKNGNGNWWIEISGENIAVTPNPVIVK